MTNRIGKTVDMQTLFAIRDAGQHLDLTLHEVVFLITIELHGIAWSAASKLMAEMRMGRTVFYETRASLIERGLLWVEEREGKSTRYEVLVQPLLDALPDRSIKVDEVSGSRHTSDEGVRLAAHPRPAGDTPPSGSRHRGVRVAAPEEDPEGDLEGDPEGGAAVVGSASSSRHLGSASAKAAGSAPRWGLADPDTPLGRLQRHGSNR